jgi:peptidoglycan/xylan/chitin deacetylase (PgdA/CDA1 family)
MKKQGKEKTLRKRLVKTMGLCLWAAVSVMLPLPMAGPSFGDDIPLRSALPALESEAPVTPTPAAVEPPPGPPGDETFEVLCYHRFVRKPDEREDSAQAAYQMPVEDFKWQMQYLKENGFTPISEGQLMDFWFRGNPLPPKPVLITFDDGFRTIYRDAFPVMKSYGYPSIFFLYTKFIENGEAALKRRADGRKKHTAKLGVEPLEVGDIISMEKSGMIVESHTANHLNLGLVNEQKTPVDYQKLLDFELSEPLTFIQSNFSRKPELIAYPYGVYDPAILQTTRAQGYKLAFTVNPGPNDHTVDPLKLRRELVLYPISHERFARFFTDKVLHMKGLSPGDGDVIDTQKPVIRAQIVDDVVPCSIRLQSGNRILRVQYDPQTRLLTHPVGEELTQGGHILTLRATDVKGASRVYNWYFRIKHKRYEKKADGGGLGMENAKN